VSPLQAVATALGIELRNGSVRAEGDLDMRGTLGVAKDASVGFRAIRLHFDLDTDAPRAPPPDRPRAAIEGLEVGPPRQRRGRYTYHRAGQQQPAAHRHERPTGTDTRGGHAIAKPHDPGDQRSDRTNAATAAVVKPRPTPDARASA
jgi:hypothetical protein